MGQFSKNYYSENCHQALKNMGLGSGIRDPEKTYSGSRIEGSKRHRIPDPEHWFQQSAGATPPQLVLVRDFGREE
jgi:hypothetical protein